MISSTTSASLLISDFDAGMCNKIPSLPSLSIKKPRLSKIKRISDLGISIPIKSKQRLYENASGCFSGLDETKWTSSSGDNTIQYLNGTFRPFPYNQDFPSFVFGETYLTLILGTILTSTSTTVIPRTYFEILPDDSDFGYNIIYTRGIVEFKKPVDLGSNFSLYSRHAYKDILNNSVSILDVIQDLIIEDVFGIPRYVWDADESQYNLNSNNDLFKEFINYINIADPKVFLNAIRLDNNSTRNCYDALSKVLGTLYSNFKIRATARGQFFGDSVVQGGAPVFSISEKINANDTEKFLNVSNPKTNNITDRDFFSLSFIGFNEYQDPDQDSSEFRRESFIFGEIGNSSSSIINSLARISNSVFVFLRRSNRTCFINVWHFFASFSV